MPIKIDTNLIKDKIIQIECGWGHTLFLTDRGEIFACGDNRKFQCGIDNGKESLEKITKIAFECTTFIKEIKSGFSRNLCMSDKGILSHNISVIFCLI